MSRPASSFTLPFAIIERKPNAQPRLRTGLGSRSARPSAGSARAAGRAGAQKLVKHRLVALAGAVGRDVDIEATILFPGQHPLIALGAAAGGLDE